MTIEFPMREYKLKTHPWKPGLPVYTLTFKGGSLVDIEPRSVGEFGANTIDLYRRDALKADRATMKEIERFAPVKVLEW